MLDLTSVGDLLDYNCPSAPGALLKCALIVTHLVDVESEAPLIDQLRQVSFEAKFLECTNGYTSCLQSELQGCVFVG